jgi:uncharacterized membrane protein
VTAAKIERVLRERHPALVEQSGHRSESRQNRIADQITSFAGSMRFVYAHIIWFGIWIMLNVGLLRGKGFDPFPFGLLTMIVSLEAIFLSTFVMISQNRADEKRQALADHQWELVQAEEKENRLLIEISQQILELTSAIHKVTVTMQSEVAAHHSAPDPLAPSA